MNGHGAQEEDPTPKGRKQEGRKQDERFAVVIVHRNGAGPLLNTLNALSKAMDPNRDRVFLVDNGSTDDSLKQVRAAYPQVTVMENGCNMGYARAVNVAVPESRSRFVLVLNNDAFVPPEALDQFEAVFDAHPKVAVVGPQLVSEKGALQRSFGHQPTVGGECARLFQQGRPDPPADPVADVDWISGACMAVRRAAIDDAGSIDSDFFFYFEDMEWCIRLRKHGWRVVLNREIRVTHIMGSSTRPLRRGAQIEMLRSRLRFYRKVFGPATAFVIGTVRFVRLCVNTLSYLLMTVCTLGLARKTRGKLLVYATLLVWWLLGKPESWGLPDRAPAGRKRSG